MAGAARTADRTATAATAAQGLTSTEAAAALARNGPNRLPPPHRPSPIARLVSQLVHFFALMLWVASGLSFVAGMPQLGVAIAVVVVVNGVFAFAQEYRADRAAERLGELLPANVIVRRDGARHTIPAAEVVVGDIVLLAAGDRVPADMTVTAARALAIDRSTLTGESVPVETSAGETANAGTFLVTGEAEGEVVATGADTRLGAIAQLTREGRHPMSPLARELKRVVRSITLIAALVGVSFFVLALLLGTPARDGFLFAIGVTVALVPEGLLPTVTLSLAMGAQRMAARHALVRRLEAVETLGSTTFICTDKTGTLTRNEMAVVALWTPAGAATISGTGYEPDGTITLSSEDAAASVRRLVSAAWRCSDGRAVRRGGIWAPAGDPMEAAVDTARARLGLSGTDLEHEMAVVDRHPFDASRRRMSVLTDGWLFVKGAPEAVLPRCRGAGGADDEVVAFTGQGLRVLAVAQRQASSVPAGASADDAERDLELLGLLALEDPPRVEAASAIAACRAAGVRVAMVTGDHPLTAGAIAREVGLASGEALVLEGTDLPDDEALLGALLDRDGVVVSRVSPEQKLRIAVALRARGHVVAMTGDGVNDGPALQEADIGIAMGRGGTDVAREASDLVLLDDNFATIVAAVEQGRATFSNIHRFLTYHLTDNVAELTPFVVWALSGGRFPLALGVLQILSLDIGTDLLPALALGAEAPNEVTLRKPPLGRHLLDATLLRRVFGVLGPVEATVEMAAFVVAMLAAGWRPGHGFPAGHALFAASGAAFTAVVVGQFANAFACRSATRWPGALGWRTNRLLVVAVGVELAALAVMLGFPPLAHVLSQAIPPAPAFGVALLAAPAVLAADAIQKRSRARRRRERDHPTRTRSMN